jgi:uncharacterized surface protein with fasciclin (FAS1) repeats
MNQRSDLIETLAKHAMFSTFLRLVNTSGASAAFGASPDFTVFAPTDDAFCKIPDERMNALLQEDKQVTLKYLLSYHIVPERLLAASLGTKRRVATITGVEIFFTDGRDGLKVNQSRVQARNIEASNGVIHSLDSLLDYDIKTYSTGPLTPLVEIRRAATSPELVYPVLSAVRSAANGTRK